MKITLNLANSAPNAGIPVNTVNIVTSNPPSSSVMDPVDEDAPSSGNQRDLADNSDCESVTSPRFDLSYVNEDGLQRVLEGDKIGDLIRGRFMSRLGSLGNHTQVEAVYKNAFSDSKSRGIMEDFGVWQGRMEQKRGGSANVQRAWCGVTKDEMVKIVRYGFRFGLPKNDGSYGVGVYLTAKDSPLECVKNLVVDEDGLRHVILCRVILGKTEVIQPGSEQDCPSTTEFDSGVDSLESPKKHIVWNFDANSHILPEFVISFRAPSCLEGLITPQVNQNKRTSSFMPFADIISALAEFLQPSAITSLNKSYKELKERKISQQDMIRRLKELAGAEILVSVVKSLRAKKSAR